jgi:hypothetical protein
MKTKKELKEEYKQMKMPIGVFQIKNNSNSKILVESSKNLNAIWNRYRLQLDMGSHPNQALQNDWKTIGVQQFTFTVLEEIEQKEDSLLDYEKELKILESMYIEELKPFGDKGYNKLK